MDQSQNAPAPRNLAIVSTATFCVLPWMTLATNSTGNFRVCCHALPGLNQIRNEAGQPMRIDRDDAREAWNSETYRTLRKEMLAQIEPKMCSRCFKEEKAGVVSFRQNMNTRFLKKIQPVIDAEGRAPFKIMYVDLRLGNLCNLRCRMCNPFASNQWLKEWDLVGDTKLRDDETLYLSRMTWPENPYIWEQLEPILDTVEEIYLTGGEPTLIKQQIVLLEKCVRSGAAGRIILKYNTNLTYIPEKLIELWPYFKLVKLNGSVDGVGPVNDYIRYPSEWATVDRNLRTMVELSKTCRIRIEVHATIQAYNLLDLPNLIEYLKPMDLFPFINILDRPAYLNVRILPRSVKDEVIEAIRPYKSRPKVSGLIRYLEEDWSHLIPEFKKYTSALDQGRQQSLERLSPKLISALTYSNV
jgi:sulfatase maturation enzyme AslB (radical SAM superfamily)